MLDNPAVLMGRPKTVTLGGKVYPLHPLDMAQNADLQAWINAQYRSPLECVREDFRKDPEYWNYVRQQHAIRVATELATAGPPKIGTPAADMMLLSYVGTAEALYLSISRGDPTFTRDMAMELVVGMDAEDTEKVLEATTLDMAMHDPKAGSPSGSSAGTPVARRPRTARGRRSTSGR